VDHSANVPRPSTRRAKIGWRECFTQGLILLALLVALFPRTFLLGETALPAALLYDVPPWNVHRPDHQRPYNHEPAIEVFLLFHAFYTMTRNAIADGEWPLWNHLEFGGMPLLANYQSAVFYPPRLPHQFLDIAWASTLFVILKLWLCGMTAYLSARVFGLRRAPSTFASIAWMLSGYHVSWAYYAIPDVGAWLPVLLIGVEFLLEGRYRRGCCAIAIAATMLLLCGHPESALTGSAGLGLYFLIRLAHRAGSGAPFWRPLGAAVAAWAIALLATAMQTLPFFEYVGQSQTYVHRVSGPEHRHFIQPGQYPIFWVPRYFGSNADDNFRGARNVLDMSNFRTMAYPGVAVTLGVLLLLAVGNSRSQKARSLDRARVIALFATTVLFLALAIESPISEALSNLPLIGSTWGCWFLTWPLFALPLLAAMGIDRWTSEARSPREFTVPVAGAVIIGIALIVPYVIERRLLVFQGFDAYVGAQLLIAALIFAIGLIPTCLAAHPRLRRWAAHAFVLLLAADLLCAARGLIASSPRDELFVDTPLTRFLQAASPPARINIEAAGIQTGLLQHYGIEQHWGYDAIMPDRMWRFYGGTSGDAWPRLAPLTATEFYLHRSAFAGPPFEGRVAELERVGTFDDVGVYRDSRVYPRAYLVGRAEVVSSTDVLFERLRESGFDPRHAVLVDSPPEAPLPPAAAALNGSASVELRKSTRVVVSTQSDSDAVLVLADAYYPGWQARVDDAPAEIFPAFHAYRAVVVPKGDHKVEFTYRPRSFRIGLLISTASLIVSLLWSLWKLRYAQPASSISAVHVTPCKST
jgi:hypothetical protein